MSLHHLEINVSDLGVSRAFWDFLLTFLGYTRYQEWDQGVSWKRGEHYLVLVQVDEKHAAARYHRRQVGLNHVAFHAESREQVDELTRELKNRGVRILYSDRHPYAAGPGYYAVYFEDPDRIKVEVVAPGA